MINEKKNYFLCFCYAETGDKDELQNKKALDAIKESLIGFTDSLENKTFLHEGALIELDSENYRPICRVYFFLLNDLLIIGKVKHDKYELTDEPRKIELIYLFLGNWNLQPNTMRQKSLLLISKTWTVLKMQ